MSRTNEVFQWRAFTSILAGFTFTVMALSGVVLFLAPSGHLARNTGWQWARFGRYDWITFHTWFSLVFLLVCVFHIYLNCRAIKRYFQSRQSKTLALRPEWIAALLLCVLILVGILRGAAPFKSLMRLRSECRHKYPGDTSQQDTRKCGRRGTQNREVQYRTARRPRCRPASGLIPADPQRPDRRLTNAYRLTTGNGAH